jgi:hypothetical protein
MLYDELYINLNLIEDNMDDRKKKAAVIAAVTGYIRNQEDASYAQASAVAPASQPAGIAPSSPLQLWGISGRQSQMLMRNHMQLKSYHLVK